MLTYVHVTSIPENSKVITFIATKLNFISDIVFKTLFKLKSRNIKWTRN